MSTSGNGSDDRYQHDVFVSYAHADNKNGWVQSFCDYMVTTVSNRGGLGELEVFFDYYDLSGNRSLANELHQHVKYSKVLFVFLSNNYLKSDWCQQEVTWFTKVRTDFTDGRIFVIRMEKLDMEMSRDLQVLQELRGYDYFESSSPFPLCWPTGFSEDAPGAKEYQAVALKLGSDVIDLLKQPVAEVTTTNSPRKQIILSPLGYALDRDKWTQTRDQLQRLGEVIPGEEDIKRALTDYGLFTDLLRSCGNATRYIQIANDDVATTIPSDVKAERFNLMDEWEYFAHKGSHPLLWSESDFLDEDDGEDQEVNRFRSFARTCATEGKAIIGSVTHLIESLSDTNADNEDDSEPQVCVDFKNEDEIWAGVFMKFLENTCGCFVETLSDKDDAKNVDSSQDAEHQVKAMQMDIVNKLGNARFAILLKKDRTNQQLFKRISHFRKVLGSNNGKDIRNLHGAVAVLPSESQEEPGGFVYLDKVDLRDVSVEHLKNPTQPLPPSLQSLVDAITTYIGCAQTEGVSPAS